MDLLKTLNEKILINDLIVKKMKYEINMLFREYPSREKASLLALKINNQLDTALKGLPSDDQESIRKLLILDSFMVVNNPVSDHIHYGHVFTTLTNYDQSFNQTKDRLSHWLDENTEISYDEEEINQYIKRYKIIGENIEIKVAAIEYKPEPKKYRYKVKKRLFLIPVSILLLIILLIFSTTLYKAKEEDIASPTIIETKPIPLSKNSSPTPMNTTCLPETYRYTGLSEHIEDFLIEKNSRLIKDDYLSILQEKSESYDINPLLLLAIIGQEQNYVPDDHQYANEIINNPYNVFGSWLDYNSTFEEATTICLNTIQTSIDTYEDGNFIEWLNNKYAEDKNWSHGVNDIFTMLQKINQE